MDLKQYRQGIILHTYQLEKVVAERDKLNRRIEQLADYIRANASFLPDAERAERLEKMERLIAGPPGFTDAVRNVLSNKPGALANAIGVRNMLMQSGYDLTQYSNPLASIHTILKRLVKSGEVTAEVRDGELYYQWSGK
ncbi:MAG: hypothetical protein ABSG52_11995 [Terriglobales bacterium]|jgi:hypothetical protein